MTGIARFVMQSPRQAAFLAVLFAAFPLLHWISAAIVALVMLRQGLNSGINILLLALLPTVVWYASQQEITAFVVIAGGAGLAAVLRYTVSLGSAVGASTLVGLIAAVLIPELAPQWYQLMQQMANNIVELLTPSFPEIALMQAALVSVMVGVMGAILQMFSLGALLLARHWQSELYHPGGYTKEFHGLRLSKVYWILSLFALLIAGQKVEWLFIVPVLLMPMMFVGVSLVHWVVAHKQLSTQWLLAFYLSLLFFLQYMYALLILVALLDAILDVRKRSKDTA